MKQRKADARLERRIKGYEDTLRNLGPGKSSGFNKPGSTRKSAPKGR